MISFKPKNLQDKPRNLKHRKVWKGVLLGVFLLLCGMVSAMVYVNLHWKSFLRAQIQQAITTSTDSLYLVSFKDVNINILTGNVNLRQIVFKPDMRIYQKFMQQGIAPPHLYRVEVAALKLAVHPLRVYSQKSLEIKSLEIDKPTIQMVYQRMAGAKDTLIILDERTAYQRLSPYLKSIKVNHIVFKDVDFKYIDKSVKQNQITGLKNLYIEITDLLIDSASQFDRSRFYYTKNIFVRLRDYELPTPNKRYHIKLKEFTASTGNRYASLNGLLVVPNYNGTEFFEKFGRDRYSMRFDNILLDQVNFKEFITQRRLNASKLSVSNSNVEIYHHQTSSSTKFQGREAVFPQVALQRFRVDTHIDTVWINNGRVSYTEYNPVAGGKGSIVFNKIQGTLVNVSNEAATIQKNQFCKANLTALLMNRGRLNVRMSFNLADPDGAFTYSGNVGFMNLHVFNSLTRPLALLEFRSGIINKMNFTGQGNRLGVRGNLDVNYESLKVNLLKKSVVGTFTKLGLESMMANILILKDDNPSPGEALRITPFFYHRSLQDSFFKMIWRGFLMGLKENAGLDLKTEEKIAHEREKFKEKKAQRQERRNERIKKRQERRLKEG
ncbi:MAG TPA: hypothetical protein VEV16_09250 [Daejeonella sp.]|nr:hypothetical protein [Daejeonella sp.]